MHRHTKHDRYSTTNGHRQTSLQLAYAETYAAFPTHLNQSPAPTNQHRHACADIRNATDISQTTAPTGRPAPSRMPGHTQDNRCPTVSSNRQTSLQLTHAQTYATTHNRRNRTKDGGTDTRTRASAGTTVSPDKQRAIDHLDRDIRHRITARVWRAAAPRRPHSSSARAG